MSPISFPFPAFFSESLLLPDSFPAMMGEATGEILLMRLRDRQSRFWRCGFSGLSGRVLLTALFGLLTAAFLWQPLPAAAASDTEASAPVIQPFRKILPCRG